MNKLFVLLLALCLWQWSAAQNIEVQSEAGKLYLLHTIAAKDNWYSIGRTYNISPREIAPFNGLDLTAGLSVGQQLKVPLTPINFYQSGSAAESEVFVPLYHTVMEKEGLYRIGQNFNKLPVEMLQVWNDLSTTEISKGTSLIIGYLKVKREQSALAATGLAAIPVGSPSRGQVTDLPPARKTENTSAIDKAVPPTTSKTDRPAVNTGTTVSQVSTDGAGFFKEQFSRQGQVGRVQSGSGGIFKSTSGWQDAKYYALMNNITPGTIIKVSNPSNRRSVFAKVLGELPPGKENEGLLIRISNSGAAELQISATDPRFEVEIGFSKG